MHPFALHVLPMDVPSIVAGSSLRNRSDLAAPSLYPYNFPGAVNLVCDGYFLFLFLVAEQVPTCF